MSRLAPLGVTLVLWEGLARLLAQPAFPPFSAVLSALVTLVAEGRIFGDLISSISALALGFGLAMAVGVTVGALMGAFPQVEEVLGPYLNAGLAAPALIYVPILFTLAGTSRWTQVFTVFLYSVFSIASYTVAGMHGTSRTVTEMARAFGATRRQTLLLVVWPGARPMLMSGLRIAMAMAVKGMINGEMLIASTGLGALVRVYGSRFEIDKVLAILLVIAIVALSSTSGLRLVERRALGDALQP
ncbi:MAG: ABC transporter permease [Vicinamibacterales bacterium]